MSPPPDVGMLKEHKDKEPDNDFIRLRKLLLGPDYDGALNKYISREDDAERVALVLASAIRQSVAEDPSIGEALAPVLDKAFQTSIAQNPSQISNVMFPVMGPAIRKSVAASLRDMVQSLNQVLEQSLSLRGLVWRFKAWRAGVSYGRYVMSQTLRYQVEQVFLVHKETGLLLHSIANEQAESNDPELVSSMLTAIQDFVRDSFNRSETSELERIEMGGLSIQLCSGPHAIIALAVRGNADESVFSIAEETLEKIHLDFSGKLADFRGDRAVFAATDNILKSCLVSEHIEGEEGSKKRPWLALVFIAMLVTFFINQSYRSYQFHAAYQRVISAIESEPGYVLVSSKFDAPQLRVTLLRDSASETLDALFSRIDEAHLHIDVNAHELTFGEIDTAKLSALTLPAPARAVTTLENYQNVIKSINSTVLLFSDKSAALLTESATELPRLISNIKTYARLNRELGMGTPQVLVLGFADPKGTRFGKQKVSKERAEHIRQTLVANEVDSEILHAWGVGQRDGPSMQPELQRRVTLHVLDQSRYSGLPAMIDTRIVPEGSQ